MVTDFQLGWLAGIIDGEGSINCKLNKPGKFSRLIGMPSPQVAVQNTSRPMIQSIAELFAAMKIHGAVSRTVLAKQIDDARL